jgi:hypothetical protein
MSSYPSLPRRNRRPVIDQNGVVHPSVMDAAEAHGFSISYAYSKARLRRGGWHFADTPARQPTAPSTASEG